MHIDELWISFNRKYLTKEVRDEVVVAITSNHITSSTTVLKPRWKHHQTWDYPRQGVVFSLSKDPSPWRQLNPLRLVHGTPRFLGLSVAKYRGRWVTVKDCNRIIIIRHDNALHFRVSWRPPLEYSAQFRIPSDVFWS